MKCARSRISIFFFLGLLVGGCASLAEKDYHGKITGHTPYDIKYQKVQEYLEKAHSFTYLKEDACFITVTETFPYCTVSYNSSSDEWQLPAETEVRGCGDCEDKALWLYVKLIEEGVEAVRFTIGKHYRYDRNAHAWVTWYPAPGAVFILDPTHESLAKEADLFTSDEYVPYYSYYRGQRWVHNDAPYTAIASRSGM